MKLVSAFAASIAAVSAAQAQQAPAAQTAPAAAADGLKITGSLRLRYEAIGGQPRAGFNASDELTELRTQITAQYKSAGWRAVVELYDSRAWGADAGTPLSTGEVNTFEPVQAYVAVEPGAALGKGIKTSLQAGRFTLDLGSRRLIALDDYRNTVTSFTGLRADLATQSGIKATAIYVLPQLRLPDDGPSLRANSAHLDRESFDAVLWGGLVSKQAKAGSGRAPLLSELSFFHYGERDAPGRPSRDRSLNNLGLRFITAPKARQFDFGVEGIYQWGHISASLASSAERLPVSASVIHAQAGYSFAGSWKPRVAVEFDRVSGDGPGHAYGRFDTLFGMRRGDLGPAGLYNAIGRANILSPAARLEVTPSNRLDAFVTYRPMWLAEASDAFSTTGVRDAAGNSGSFAGHQFDMRLRYWLVPKYLRFELDGTYIAKGRFLQSAPNAPRDGDARYISLNLTASI